MATFVEKDATNVGEYPTNVEKNTTNVPKIHYKTLHVVYICNNVEHM